MLKIRTKITLISTVFYSALLLLIGLFAINDTIKSHTNIYDVRLEKYFSEFISKFENLFLIEKKLDEVEIDKIIKTDSEDLVFQIYDENLNLISTKHLDFNYDDELINALTDDLESFIDADELDRHYYYNFKKTTIGSKTIIFSGRIRSAELDFEYYKHYLFFVLVIPVYIIIVTLLSFQLSKSAFNPIAKMINKTKEITHSNLHHRIDVTGPKDEIRELAVTLNGMIERLENSFLSQKNFVSNASHEIKTPLTIIRADLENLKDSFQNERADEEINVIINEVDRLTNLSKSLLKLSKIDSGETNFQKLRIDELIIECTQTFYKTAAEKNINFNISLDDDLEILGDKEKLISVFQNLLDNSIKYSEPNKNIFIGLKKDNGFVEITIEDKGFGIKEEDIDKIYNRFFRSDDYRASIQGNGLGLSIVSEIIKSHNGNISCNSKLGIGTSFKVILPIQLS